MALRLLTLLLLSLFLTACSSSDDSTSSTPPPYVAPPSVDYGGYLSFIEVSQGAVDDSIEKTIMLEGTAVGGTLSKDFTRTTADATANPLIWDNADITVTAISIADIAEPHISITYGKNGKIAVATLKVDETYTGADIEIANGVTGVGTSVANPEEPDNPDANSFNQTFAIKENFNNADYMIGIEWGKHNAYPDTETGETASLTAEHGYMVAGFETAVEDIPAERTFVRFSGVGEGYYSGVLGKGAVSFSVTSTVNFVDRTATFTTDTNSADGISDTAKLNISLTGETALMWEEESNLLTGTAEIITQAEVKEEETITTPEKKLSGSVNAIFYGHSFLDTKADGTAKRDDMGNQLVNTDNVAQELGGTFNLTGTDAVYYGMFGAKQ